MLVFKVVALETQKFITFLFGLHISCMQLNGYPKYTYINFRNEGW